MEHDLYTLHSDIEETHWWFVGRRKILVELVHALVPPNEGRTVVDIGCGTGANIAALVGEYRCVGFDVAADALRLASARHQGIAFRPMTELRDAADALAGADVVVLSDVLEHVEHDTPFLRDLVQAIRPGAVLLLTVPALPSLWTRHDIVFGHFRRYESDTLRALWHQLPVRPRLLSFFNARLYPLIRARRWWRQRHPAGAGVEATDFREHNPLSNAVLARIFAGERHRLRAVLAGRGRPYARGASLCAVLERLGAPAADR